MGSEFNNLLYSAQSETFEEFIKRFKNSNIDINKSTWDKKTMLSIDSKNQKIDIIHF